MNDQLHKYYSFITYISNLWMIELSIDNVPQYMLS